MACSRDGKEKEYLQDLGGKSVSNPRRWQDNIKTNLVSYGNEEFVSWSELCSMTD
jgi:hypothetical protein